MVLIFSGGLLSKDMVAFIILQNPDCNLNTDINNKYLIVFIYTSHERLIRLYKPIPMSWFSGIFGYLDGTIAEYADAEKVIARGEGRDGKLILNNK